MNNFWDFRIGDILSALAFAGGGAGAFVLVKIAIDRLAQRVGTLESTVLEQSREIKKLVEVMITLARYDEKFVNVDARFVSMQQQITDNKRDIDDLRRGRGYIKGAGANE